MEIVVIIIVAACILMAWGPRVLLAVIVVPPVLFYAALFAFANNGSEQTKLTAKPAITKTCVEVTDGEWITLCPAARP